MPTLKCGSESWLWYKKHERRINGALRSIYRVRLTDRVRKGVIKEKCGLKDVVTKLEMGIILR